MNYILAIENFDIILVLVILLSFGILETILGFLTNSKRTKGDWTQELVSFFVLSIGIKPAIVTFIYMLGFSFYPEGRTLLSSQSIGSVLLGYILIDDLLQYWYHRSAHERTFLWKLHRAHHQAEEMGYLISYRNAMLYYFLMPNIWWVGVIVFAGGAKAVAIGLVLKQLVIISSHSHVKWDKPFYKYSLLRPIIKILERIIITPSFHHAHHGKSILENASNPDGNFGNMFSIWDQLFGTASFHHSYPNSYGLQEKTDDPWTAAYFYPFITSSDKKSDWYTSHQPHNTATKKPMEVTLEKGKSYLWCACGKSGQQPFCNGSHHGTTMKPIKFTAKRSGKVSLCNCKATKKAPFCDDSHLKL